MSFTGKADRKFSDDGKIFAAIVLCMLSFAVIITSGMIIEKRSAGAGPEIVIETVSAVTVSSITEAELININTADKYRLQKLDGIGEKTAEAIIEYRKNKPFESPEDIMNVDGIGEKKYEDIKDKICVC